MQTESEQALHALKAAALYLQHPDVQAIPFAQPASVALRRVNAAINRLQFGEHLKHSAETVKLWPAWKRNLLGSQ